MDAVFSSIDRPSPLFFAAFVTAVSLLFLGVFSVYVLLFGPAKGRRAIRAGERLLLAAGKRRAVAIFVCSVLTLLAAVVFVQFRGYPTPRVHDEFSYLLAADTFASGRLANPAHPFWPHFETPHVNQQPTYVSMYPPAQGVFLAAGQVLFGHPWWGVVLSAVLFSAASCWALQAWFPLRWAYAGGLIAMLMTAFNYWTTSYWGGAVAGLGGALLLGAAPRLLRRLRPGVAAVAGIGMVLLVNSRQYEGLILSAAVASWMAWRLWRRGAILPALTRIVIPAGLVCACGILAMMYYFWRTTGDPARPPYVVNLETYMIRGMFLFTADRPEPVYLHREMQATYRKLLREEMAAVERIGDNVRRILWTYIDRLRLPLLLLIPCVLASRRVRPLMVILGLVLGAAFLVRWVNPHYIAPVAVVFAALQVEAIRRLRIYRRSGLPVGRVLALFALLTIPAQFVAKGAHEWWGARFPPGWEIERERIGNQLESGGGRHLVLVRYRARHDPFDEWVYNRADLEGAPVVWAREMSPAEDRALMDHYKDRRVWLATPDRFPIFVLPYTPFPLYTGELVGTGQ